MAQENESAMGREEKDEAIETEGRKRNRRKVRGGVKPAALLLTVLITAVLVGVIAYLVAYKQVKQEFAYSRQPIVIEEGEVLETLKDNLSAGNSVMTSLRKSFSDYLIIYDSKKYIFQPIDYTRKMHEREPENLRLISDNEWEYQENGKTVSHKGIDVSAHQGEIDWAKVKEDGVEFAMLRAVYRGYETGKLVVDKTFEQNAKGATEAGIPIGVYLFSQAVDQQELDEEIKLLEDTIKPYNIVCPVVMDIETAAEGQGRADGLSMEERTKLARYFADEIDAAGYRPMLYFNYEAAMLLVDTAQLEDVDKWYASYTKDFYYPYYYSIWQYSEEGTVNGIEGNVDMDMSFEKFW